MPDGTYLRTARLVLRRFTAADAADLAALHGDPAVMRYVGSGRPEPRTYVEQEVLPGFLRDYGELPPGFGHFAATAEGTFLGWFSLRPATSFGLSGGTELGYRLTAASWGRGYATEGARALVRHAFTELGVDRVVATTMAVNTASRRVLEKSGLRLVRRIFATWPDPIDGAEHGDVVYELTRAAWARA